MQMKYEYWILSAYTPLGLVHEVNVFLRVQPGRDVVGGPFYADGKYHQAVTHRGANDDNA